MAEYLSAVEEFIIWEGDSPIREVDGKRIANCTYHLLNGRRPKISPRTVDKKLNAIAALFQQVRLDDDWGRSDEFPTAGHFVFKKQKRRHAEPSDSGYHRFSDNDLKKIFALGEYLKNACDPHR